MKSSLRRTTVLLVPGSDSDADRFEAELARAAPSEFEVTRATTLAGARSNLETKSADCVAVDLALGAAEGTDLLELLAVGAPDVAFLGLTDCEEDELIDAVTAAGVSDFLPKAKLEGTLLVRSLRLAILRKRFETSLAEAEIIGRFGSWELDVATESVRCSRELCRMFGFGIDEQPTYAALIDRTHPDDRASAIKAVRTAVAQSSPFIDDHRVLLPDGSLLWVRARGRVELGHDGRPERLLATVQEITEQKTAEQALLHQALHDPLSGLPNRLLFLDRLSQALKRLARHPSTVGVVYLDIDRFKVINDSLGHAVGDQLLLAMANRLKALVRPGGHPCPHGRR